MSKKIPVSWVSWSSLNKEQASYLQVVYLITVPHVCVFRYKILAVFIVRHLSQGTWEAGLVIQNLIQSS